VCRIVGGGEEGGVFGALDWGSILEAEVGGQSLAEDNEEEGSMMAVLVLQEEVRAEPLPSSAFGVEERERIKEREEKEESLPEFVDVGEEAGPLSPKTTWMRYSLQRTVQNNDISFAETQSSSSKLMTPTFASKQRRTPSKSSVLTSVSSRSPYPRAR